MSNTTLNATVVAKAALAILDNELDVLGTFYRAPEEEFDKRVNGYTIGDTVSIRRPADFTVRNTITASVQDVIEGKTDLTIDQVRGVDFSFTSTDLTLDIKELGERVIRPAMINIANEVASDCLSTMYKGVYNHVGTPGSAINTFAKFNEIPKRLHAMAVPTDARYAALNSSDYFDLVSAQGGMYIDQAAKQAYRDGSLGRITGIETMATQLMPTHVIGQQGGTPLVNGASQNVSYDTAKNTWSQSLITDGWTAAAANRLKAGDVFTIYAAGTSGAKVKMVNPKTKAVTSIDQQFVVLSDAASDGSGNATLTISPPIITSGPHQTVNVAPADNAGLVVLGTASASVTQSLAYHKNSFALAVVPMVKPPGAVDVGRETKNGLSVRVIPYYTGSTDVSAWRLDILYGRKLIDPRLALRAGG